MSDPDTTMAMNVLLIGARGSGKSSLGRAVADALGCPFVDLDVRALKRFGEPTVRDVWSAYGEGAWRDAEVQALADALGEGKQVVALGGGTPMIAEARRLITAQQSSNDARCVYLRCSVDELARRLSAVEGDRPSLTGKSVVDEIGEVLAAREPTYRDLADHELDVTSLTVQEAADAVIRLLRQPATGRG